MIFTWIRSNLQPVTWAWTFKYTLIMIDQIKQIKQIDQIDQIKQERLYYDKISRIYNGIDAL